MLVRDGRLLAATELKGTGEMSVRATQGRRNTDVAGRQVRHCAAFGLDFVGRPSHDAANAKPTRSSLSFEHEELTASPLMRPQGPRSWIAISLREPLGCLAASGSDHDHSLARFSSNQITGDYSLHN
jgi:hypothetical protein